MTGMARGWYCLECGHYMNIKTHYDECTTCGSTDLHHEEGDA